MCVSVSGDEMMCRFDPARQETADEKNGFRTMIMKGRGLKGYGYISEEGIKSKKDFNFRIGLALKFNKKAKAAKQSEERIFNASEAGHIGMFIDSEGNEIGLQLQWLTLQ